MQGLLRLTFVDFLRFDAYGSIIEGLKSFCMMLWASESEKYTDRHSPLLTL
jgi:hypothetical protein